MTKGIRDKVAIVGMGCSQFGERWDTGSEAYQAWVCGSSGTDFTLTPGEGVIIKVTAATNWTPSHY